MLKVLPPATPAYAGLANDERFNAEQPVENGSLRCSVMSSNEWFTARFSDHN